MNIDDPIKAAEALIQSEDRQRSPVTEHIAEAIAALEIPGAALVSGYLDRRRAENRDLLISVLRDELRKLSERFDRLSDKHKRFLQRDYAELVADGLRKAENLRAKERVIRIAAILGRAAEDGPSAALDETEEMMRIAMALDDIDVTVLKEFVQTQADILKENNNRAVFNVVNPLWKKKRPCPKMHEGELTSVCGKLESFGLIIRMDKNNSVIGPDEMSPYALLGKGERFVRYIEYHA